MGFRAPLLAILIFGVGCGKHHDGGDNVDGGGSGGFQDACSAGIACFQVDCGSKGLQPTTISGKVFAPNGTLPLYGVNVYVPQQDPGPFPDGAVCDRCDAQLPGSPLVATQTDEAGAFSLENVPATANVPIVIQSGKWRRELMIPNVAACQTLPLDAVETTFPKSRTDMTPHTVRVDMPKVAITTGNSDAVECLIRKLGIADSEFTTDVDAAPGRINLFDGNGRVGFSANPALWTGGQGTFSNATALWGTIDKDAALAKLKNYDIVMFSCEGGQGAGTKSQMAMDAVHDYADFGGRVFMTHWHNIWIAGDFNDTMHSEADWKTVGTFNTNPTAPPGALQNDAVTINAQIDETVPKGMSFAQWMLNVGGSDIGAPPVATRDAIFTTNPRFTLTSNDPAKSDRRVFFTAQATDPNVVPDPRGQNSVQELEFTTPQNVQLGERCGKVVFSDMHVASGSSPNAGGTFPDGCCGTAGGGCVGVDLSPQEKALAFIFFDIASCVGQIN